MTKKEVAIGAGAIIAAILAILFFWKRGAAAGIVNPEIFRFTEIVENHLPEYIIGWAEATCSGTYNYVPPAGYARTSCEQASQLGVHSGCPDCIMSQVRCDRIS